MPIDRFEIDWGHLAAARAVDVQPPVARLQRGADGGRPVLRRPVVRGLDQQLAAPAFGSGCLLAKAPQLDVVPAPMGVPPI